MKLSPLAADKVLKHLDRLDGYCNGGIVPPIMVEIHPTNICNLKCPFCFGKQDGCLDTTQVSYSRVASLLREVKGYGCKAVVFSGGGDPMCHTDIMRMVRAAYQLGLDIGLITNGTLMSSDISSELLRMCKWVRVSLAAASPARFKEMHGGTEISYNKVVKHIQQAAEIKVSLGGQAATLGIGYLTGYKDSLEDVKKFVEMFSSVDGIDYLQFRPIEDRTVGEGLFTIDDSVMNYLRSLLSEDRTPSIYYSQGKYEKMFQHDLGRRYNYCHGAELAALVGADLNLYPCCHYTGNKELSLGSLSEKSFVEIWEGKRELLEKIDVSKCIACCRHDGKNEFIHSMLTPSIHKNFI